jgi:syntaxin 16
VRELVENQKDIIRRDQELRDVLRDIVELQQLFGQFSNLVIEQGTLLDRIDYNVESAQTSMQSAVKNLTEAEIAQKSSVLTCCIIVLAIGVVLASFLLMFRVA